jgi:hypothetical protein
VKLGLFCWSYVALLLVWNHLQALKGYSNEDCLETARPACYVALRHASFEDRPRSLCQNSASIGQHLGDYEIEEKRALHQAKALDERAMLYAVERGTRKIEMLKLGTMKLAMMKLGMVKIGLPKLALA